MKFLFLLPPLLMLTGCMGETEKSNAENVSSEFSTEQSASAKQILTTACYACHNTAGGQGNRLAPPMEAVKRRYMMSYNKEKEFVAAFSSYVLSPSEENSLMRGAVNRFGVMPEMAYTKEDLEAIASYVFNNDLEKPEWFYKQYRQMNPEDSTRMGMGNGKRNQHRRQGQN